MVDRCTCDDDDDDGIYQLKTRVRLWEVLETGYLRGVRGRKVGDLCNSVSIKSIFIKQLLKMGEISAGKDREKDESKRKYSTTESINFFWQKDTVSKALQWMIGRGD